MDTDIYKYCDHRTKTVGKMVNKIGNDFKL